MSKHRVPTDLPREDFLTALHYALRYPMWEKEIETPPDTAQAIRYDRDRVQTSGDYDPVQTTAIRREEIGRKMALVDKVCLEVGKELSYYLKLGVCYGLTWWQLEAKGIPCSRNTYYTMRKRFYFELSLRI